MIRQSLLVVFLPVVLGGIGELNGGNFGGGYGGLATPNTMSGNVGSSGNSDMIPGNRPLTEIPPPPQPVSPRPIRVPYTCSLYVDFGYFCPSGYTHPSTQYYYNPVSQRCQPFYYRGCGGTPNRFSSKNECLRGCGCFSDIEYRSFCPVSPFQQYTIRYAFNQYTGTCQSFRFNTCSRGNDNNFRSQLECQTACGPLFGSNDIDAPPFRYEFVPNSNSMQLLNMVIPERGSSRKIGSSSDMAIESDVPSNTGSRIDVGTSSILPVERPSPSFSSVVMGFPAFQNNFGSSALSEGNSAMNGRLNMMPSPLKPGIGPVINLNSHGMQNAAYSVKRNKFY